MISGVCSLSDSPFTFVPHAHRQLIGLIAQLRGVNNSSVGHVCTNELQTDIAVL